MHIICNIVCILYIYIYIYKHIYIYIEREREREREREIDILYINTYTEREFPSKHQKLNNERHFNCFYLGLGRTMLNNFRSQAILSANHMLCLLIQF